MCVRIIDGVRDTVAEILEMMLNSGIWNCPILGESAAKLDGMRLAQERVMREMSYSINQLFCQAETLTYTVFLSKEVETGDDDNESMHRSQVNKTKQEVESIGTWIKSTL